MDWAVATKRRGFGSTRTQRLITKLVDGGEVNEMLQMSVCSWMVQRATLKGSNCSLVIFFPA